MTSQSPEKQKGRFEEWLSRHPIVASIVHQCTRNWFLVLAIILVLVVIYKILGMIEVLIPSVH